MSEIKCGDNVHIFIPPMLWYGMICAPTSGRGRKLKNGQSTIFAEFDYNLTYNTKMRDAQRKLVFIT
jgi:hypothetical protein